MRLLLLCNGIKRARGIHIFRCSIRACCCHGFSFSGVNRPACFRDFQPGFFREILICLLMGKREVLRGEKPACLGAVWMEYLMPPRAEGGGAGPEEGEPLVKAFKRVLFPKLCKDGLKPDPPSFSLSKCTQIASHGLGVKSPEMHELLSHFPGITLLCSRKNRE